MLARFSDNESKAEDFFHNYSIIRRHWFIKRELLLKTDRRNFTFLTRLAYFLKTFTDMIIVLYFIVVLIYIFSYILYLAAVCKLIIKDFD